MATYSLNIKKVIENAKTIEGLVNTAWLFTLKRNDEIVLEVDKPDTSLLLLRVLLIVLTEEILRNNPSLKTEENQNINFPDIKVGDYKSLATALTKTTGIKFSVAIV